MKDTNKAAPSFSLVVELSKVKIPVPLTELVKNKQYKSQILKVLNLSDDSVSSDSINLQDDAPTIMFVPHSEKIDSSIPPFYITLEIHDMLLHNAMLDSGASHNLMPKKIMEHLGLEIMRPYHDLFSFDSNKVPCIGLIKYISINLSQIPAKNVLMDVVVADISPRFGMKLSRSWAANLGGTLQMNMSYATIPIFGKTRRLYRETQIAYMVSNKDKSENHPIYAINTEVRSSIFYADGPGEVEKEVVVLKREETEGFW